MSKPLISVIVPIYNIKKYIADCVESIIEQSYENLEIMLVDDGSHDGSEKICDEYAKIDKRIRVIHKENGGLSDARNVGIDLAHGEYVTFVDGDDALENTAVEYLYDLIDKFDADMSICSFSIVKKKKINVGKKYQEVRLNTDECLEKMLMEEGFNVTAWGKLYPRSFFKNIQFPVGKLHEDVGTTYKLIMQSKVIAYGPNPEYLYYQRKNSIVRSEFKLEKISLIHFTDQMCDEIDSKYPNLKNVTNRRRMRARIAILARVLNNKDFSETEAALITYLKKNKDMILKNPKATVQDKIAIRSLLLGKYVFMLFWKGYELFFK